MYKYSTHQLQLLNSQIKIRFSPLINIQRLSFET